MGCELIRQISNSPNYNLDVMVAMVVGQLKDLKELPVVNAVDQGK